MSITEQVKPDVAEVVHEAAPITEYAVTTDPDVIAEARRLTAEQYLGQGYIEPSDIELDGTINETMDPYTGSSKYYVAKRADGSVAATVRKICYDPAKGEESFPVLAHKSVLESKFVDEIEAAGLDHCIEFSALAKDEGVEKLAPLMLYRTMWQDALRQSGTPDEETIWLMSAKPALFRQFKNYFNGAIEQIGPRLDYPGEQVVPAIMRPIEGLIDLVRNIDEKPRLEEMRRFVVDLLIDGIDISELPLEAQELLAEKGFVKSESEAESEVEDMSDSPDPEFADEVNPNTEDQNLQNIESTDKSFMEKVMLRKAEAAFAAFLVGYTVLRTMAVKNGFNEPGDQVDWRVFLGIEVATTPPYTLAAGNIVRSVKNPEDYSIAQRVKSGAVFTSALMAPYAYVGALGGEAAFTRPSVVLPMGVFGVVSVASIYSKVRSARNEAAVSELDPTTEN